MHHAYEEIIRITYNEGILMTEAELRVIGESHSRVGTWLMEARNFPPIFGEIANHHQSVMETQKDSRSQIGIVRPRKPAWVTQEL